MQWFERQLFGGQAATSLGLTAAAEPQEGMDPSNFGFSEVHSGSEEDEDMPMGDIDNDEDELMEG